MVCGLPQGGRTVSVLKDLVKECNATAVYCNRQYEPAALARDKGIVAALTAQGVAVHQHNASLLWEPWDVPVAQETQARTHFGTLMAFMKPAKAVGEPPFPVPTPASLPRAAHCPPSLSFEELGLYRAPIRTCADGAVEVIDWGDPIIRYSLHCKGGGGGTPRPHQEPSHSVCHPTSP